MQEIEYPKKELKSNVRHPLVSEDLEKQLSYDLKQHQMAGDMVKRYLVRESLHLEAFNEEMKGVGCDGKTKEMVVADSSSMASAQDSGKELRNAALLPMIRD